jgi:hypothetical protein
MSHESFGTGSHRLGRKVKMLTNNWISSAAWNPFCSQNFNLQQMPELRFATNENELVKQRSFSKSFFGVCF